MRKRYILLIVLFGALCIILPFILNICYNIGDETPLVCLRFTASDMLSYISTSIGLLISIIAIVISLKTSDTEIVIKHAHTISTNNNEAIYYQIINNSVFDCKITSFELANKRAKRYCKVIWRKPFLIKSKQSYYQIIDLDEIKKYLKSVESEKGKIYYCIRTSINQTIYLSSKDLFKCLKESEKTQMHNEKNSMGGVI